MPRATRESNHWGRQAASVFAWLFPAPPRLAEASLQTSGLLPELWCASNGCKGAAVGLITSAAWSYRIRQNLAMGYVDPENAVENPGLEVLIQGRTVKAVVCNSVPFDQDNFIPRQA